MARSKRGNPNENIPDEIVSDILSRLPLESIMVCKSVCKPWNFLINHNYFINLYLSKTNLNPSSSSSFPPSHILFEADWSSSHCSATKLYIFNMETGKVGGVQGFPQDQDKTPMTITSSLDGLICFAPKAVDNNSLDPVVLLNPLISGDHIYLPKSTHHSKSFRSLTLGFDNVTNKYKVVRIFDDIPLCEVFTIGGKSSSWRRVKFGKGKTSSEEYWSNNFGKIYREGVYHQGSIYWILQLHCTRFRFILELDLSREVFRTLSFNAKWSNYCIPINNNNNNEAQLQCLGEYLTLTDVPSLCVWLIVKRKISGVYKSRVFGYTSITTEEAPHSAEITDWIKLTDSEDDFLLQTSSTAAGVGSKHGKIISFYRPKNKGLPDLQSLFLGAQNVYPRCFRPSLVSTKEAMNDSRTISHP